MKWSIPYLSHKSAWERLTKDDDGYLTADTVDDLVKQLQAVASKVETKTSGGVIVEGLGKLEVEDYTDQVDTFYRDRRNKRRRFITCFCEG